MTLLIIFLITICISFVLAYNWIKDIEYMHKNHPDYKGEDLFREDVDKK